MGRQGSFQLLTVFTLLTVFLLHQKPNLQQKFGFGLVGHIGRCKIYLQTSITNYLILVGQASVVYSSWLERLLAPHDPKVVTGVRMGFGKKSEKCVMSSSMGGYTRIVKGTPKDIVSCRGVLPRKFLDSRVADGAFQYFFGSFYQIPLPPLSKKNYLQIYTDLKNGPGSLKKVWNQTKVWRFCPLLWVWAPGWSIQSKSAWTIDMNTTYKSVGNYQSTAEGSISAAKSVLSRPLDWHTFLRDPSSYPVMFTFCGSSCEQELA